MQVHSTAFIPVKLHLNVNELARVEELRRASKLMKGNDKCMLIISKSRISVPCKQTGVN